MFALLIEFAHAYSRAATISFTEFQVQLLFEGGYYSGCGFYSNKYGILAGILMFDIYFPKSQNFVPAEVSYLHYVIVIDQFLGFVCSIEARIPRAKPEG